MKHTRLVIYLAFISIATLIAFSFPGVTHAADLDCSQDLSPAGKELFCNDKPTLVNNKDTLSVVINNISTWLVGIIGSILAVVILVSAVQIVSSGGSPEAMKSAKNRLTQAAISLGLLISFRAIILLIGL